ncbi:hypothetical protein ACS0TY_018509 [Phlomoides rotata]
MVETTPVPQRGTRDPNVVAGTTEARDMEKSTDNAPPTVVVDQLEAFKKEIEAMHKYINDRVSNHRLITGRQFTTEILQDELPFNFKPLNYEYDGTMDPYEHLMQFENLVILHRYGDGVKCRVFLTTLSKTPNNGSAALEVPTISQEVKINTLTNGLRDEDFFSSLAKKPVETFDDWLMRDKKYITLEEVRKAKKAETKPSVTEKKKAPKVKLVSHELTGERFQMKF